MASRVWHGGQQCNMTWRNSWRHLLAARHLGRCHAGGPSPTVEAMEPEDREMPLNYSVGSLRRRDSKAGRGGL